MADEIKLRPASAEDAGTEPFWEAARRGVLMIKRCEDCTRPHYYPRAICPHCGSDRTVWEESAGHGTLYTLSTMRRGAGTPYTLAYVVLDEGPAVLTNIVTADHDALAIGQRMTVRFIDTEGAPVPGFAPAG